MQLAAIHELKNGRLCRPHADRCRWLQSADGFTGLEGRAHEKVLFGDYWRLLSGLA